MSLFPSLGGGHYGIDGQWVQTKHCFVSCGDRCDCMPPLGQYYSAMHDLRLKQVAQPAAEPSPPLTDPWDSWRPERTIA